LDKKELNVAVHTTCGNCGATLMGPYCFSCGQHAHESARSISVLYHDAWHLVTHIDGRFWQSLYILLLKPGKLTKEYFAERRARYLPPVRLYLVLSVLFFAFGLATPEKSRVAPRVAPPGAAAPGKQLDQGVVDQAPAAKKKKRTRVFDINDCNDVKSSIGWLQNIMRQSCLRNQEDGGESVERAFIANVPKMMFVFVPMMAVAMLLLYWRPRRYYVEHLVFFLHNHAAIFLLLLIQALLAWIAAWLAWGTFAGWVIAIISLYSVWYVYRAMRVYYGQGRLLTFTKLCVVGFTYLIGFSLTLAATALVIVMIE
jgi:hypothetical protein